MENSSSEERVLLLENWKEFELKHGDKATQEHVQNIMPKRIKKRRQITNEDGTDAGWEEYYDYIFPQDQCKYLIYKSFFHQLILAAKINFKLLEAARKWREKNVSAGTLIVE